MSRNPRRGGILGGLILTVLILTVLVVVVFVSAGLYVAQNVRVTERRDRREASVETPFGSFRVHHTDRLDPSAMGVPVYPGAKLDEDSHKLADFHFDFGRHHKDFAIAGATYRTRDSVAAVESYYRDRLPHWMVTQTHHGDIDGLHLEMKEGGYRKMIAIYEDDGETRIGLASVGDPGAN